ncbi:MAG TPA: hypothetical protein VGN17_04900 [Bryobacteraceae bacterium]|jgi:hypothetical protein
MSGTAMKNRTLFFFAFWAFSCYLLAIPSFIGHEYHGIDFAIDAAESVLPALIVFIPISEDVKAAFKKKQALIGAAFIVLCTLALLAYTKYNLVTNGDYFRMIDVNGSLINPLVGIGAVVTGVGLTYSLPTKTARSVLAVWAWALGIFIVQLLLIWVLWIGGIGPIA